MSVIKPSDLSKFRHKTLTRWVTILTHLAKDKYPAQVARDMNMDRRKLHYHIKNLREHGLIQEAASSNIKTYSLTQKGISFLREHRQSSANSVKKRPCQNRSLGESDPHQKEGEPVKEPKTARTHNLKVKLNILHDNDQSEWSQKTQINNWIKQFERQTFPIGITIEKTTQAIIAHFHEFSSDWQMYSTDFLQHVMRGLLYVYHYLKDEKAITVDLNSTQILNHHVGNEMPEFDGAVDPQKTVSADLQRTAKNIFPTNMQAQAWIDRSQGQLELETNDKSYEEKLVMMPEYLHDMVNTITPTMTEFSRQIQLHLQVQQQTSEMLSEMKDTLAAIRQEMRSNQ